MKQLTVLVPNEMGVAARVALCLSKAQVNIEEIDIEGMENHGLIVLSVDRYDIALQALLDAGFQAVTQDTLLVRLDDKPGALAAVALRLKDAGLDLRSMHIIRRENGITYASLLSSNNTMAARVLADVLAVDPPA